MYSQLERSLVSVFGGIALYLKNAAQEVPSLLCESAYARSSVRWEDAMTPQEEGESRPAIHDSEQKHGLVGSIDLHPLLQRFRRRRKRDATRRSDLTARRIWFLIAALASALPAASQVSPTQRIRERPAIATSIPRQQVVFTDGNYALVDHKSVSDRHKQKSVEAKCPAGMKAMSAGFAAASSAGEPPGYRVILSTPTDNGGGWKIYAAFDSSGNVLAADFDWELRIHLVCGKFK